VSVDRPGRRRPHVVLLIINPLAFDLRAARAADAEVYEERVVSNGSRTLAGLEHIKRDGDAGREAVARARGGAGDHRDAATVRGCVKTGEPLDLGLNLRALNQDGRDEFPPLLLGARAVNESVSMFGHNLFLQRQLLPARSLGETLRGCGKPRPIPS